MPANYALQLTWPAADLVARAILLRARATQLNAGPLGGSNMWVAEPLTLIFLRWSALLSALHLLPTSLTIPWALYAGPRLPVAFRRFIEWSHAVLFALVLGWGLAALFSYFFLQKPEVDHFLLSHPDGSELRAAFRRELNVYLAWMLIPLAALTISRFVWRRVFTSSRAA
jgi:hypothetical protein